MATAKTKTTPRWAQRLQAAMLKGWTCWEDRGRVRVAYRRTVEGKRLTTTVTLELAWAADAVDDAVAAVAQLEQAAQAGLDLREAAKRLRASAASPALGAPTACGDIWAQMLRSYQKQLETTGLQIKATTWKTNYQGFLSVAVEAMGAPAAPVNAVELAEVVIEHWADRPRSRALAVNALEGFLAYGVHRYGLAPGSWTLSEIDAKRLRGRKPEKRLKATLDDAEILGLIDSLPQTPAGDRWRNALRLLALYGLRPEELNHLVARQHPSTGELVMFCTYRKTCGASRTEPRWLLPVPLVDATGETMQWNLAGAMAAGLLELPVMGTKHALLTFLRRQPRWKQLAEQTDQRGEWLRPYAFRDSYSLRCHRRGLGLDVTCRAMGHSLAVHQSSYIWSNEATVLDALALT